MNLIPFAKSQETNLLVDVADVPSGQKCGCICPSCNLPLIAKKGVVNEWHFAHDSKYLEKDQELSCDFSWAVAVKMMIKQLLMEGNRLTLPDYYIGFQGVGYQAVKRKIKVTGSSEIIYTNPELKSLDCDVTVNIQGKKLGIVLLTKLSSTEEDSSYDKSLLGVVAISIEKVGYDAEGKAVNHLREQLKTLIESHTDAKHWLYHARENAAYKRAAEEERKSKENDTFTKHEPPENILRDLIKRKRSGMQTPTVIPPKPLTKRWWHCALCKFDYQGHTTGENPCPKCNSHFYRV